MIELEAGETKEIAFILTMQQNDAVEKILSGYADLSSTCAKECEALVKQWDTALPFIQNKKLDVWTHNKAIQKACESFRVSPEHKEYLRSLRIN